MKKDSKGSRWVQCERCEIWRHAHCAGISEQAWKQCEQGEKAPEFVCSKCKALVAATAAPASPPPFQIDLAPPVSDSVPPLPCPPPPDPPHDAHLAAAAASAPPLPSPEHDEGAEEGGKAEEKKKRVTIMEVDEYSKPDIIDSKA